MQYLVRFLKCDLLSTAVEYKSQFVLEAESVTLCALLNCGNLLADGLCCQNVLNIIMWCRRQ